MTRWKHRFPQLIGLGYLLLAVVVLIGAQASSETPSSTQVLLLYDTPRNKQFVEERLAILDLPLSLSFHQVLPNESPNLRLSDLVEVDVIFVVMRDYPLAYDDALILLLSEFSSRGGTILIWQPSLLHLPVNMRAFFALTNVSRQWEAGIGPPSQFTLQVTDPNLGSSPYSFAFQEELSFLGYGSALTIEATVHELITLQSVKSLPFDDSPSPGSAACYVPTAAGSRRYLVSVSPVTLEQTPRFSELMTNLFSHVLQSVPSPKMSSSPPSTSLIPPIAPTTSLMPPIPPTSEPPATITSPSDSLVTTSPVLTSPVLPSTSLPPDNPMSSSFFDQTSLSAPITLGAAALTLGGLGAAAIAARSVPPPVTGVPKRTDFFHRLFWYVFFPLLWVLGHVVYPPIVRRLKHGDVLDNVTRLQILDLLQTRGIAHFREIHREVATSFSVLRWHLQVLEDFNHLQHTKVGRYTVYYLRDDALIQASTEAAFLLKNPNTRSILTEIRRQPMIHQAELARLVTLHHDTIQYHVAKLLAVNLLCSVSDGKFTRYYLTDEQTVLVNVLLAHIQPEPNSLPDS